MTDADPVAVREALRRLLLDAATPPANGASDERLGAHARELCGRAHRAGVPVERLLATLKDEWRGMPEVAALPYRDARAVLSALVSRCIDEFYRAEAGGDSGAMSRGRAAG